MWRVAVRFRRHDRPSPRDSVFRRKYVLPFALSLAVLVCNQATGCNAIQYFALVYFAVAAFLLPETKGKTLSEIEAYFERKKRGGNEP